MLLFNISSLCRLSGQPKLANQLRTLRLQLVSPSLQRGLSCHAQSPTPGTRDIDVSKLVVRTKALRGPKPAAESLTFGETFTDHMLVLDWSQDRGWMAPEIKPYGNLSIDPSASVLQYATCLFEGMKAFKSADGTIRLFRPEMNMSRMNRSAQRLAFPAFDGSSLLDLIKRLVKLDSDWIPTQPDHSLYIRPTLIGTSPGLSLRPASELKLFVICSPLGPFYRNGLRPISLLASSKYCRAWPGGCGAFKLGANYSTGLVAQAEATQAGYEQMLWLFGDDEYVTEGGTMNMFVAVEDENGAIELVTPPLDSKILPGVTRDAVLALLRAHLSGSQRLEGLPANFRLSERAITMSELVARAQKGQLTEVFGTWTAAIVSSVARIGYKGTDLEIPVESTGAGRFATVIRREMLGRQTGAIPSEWSVVV